VVSAAVCAAVVSAVLLALQPVMAAAAVRASRRVVDFFIIQYLFLFSFPSEIAGCETFGSVIRKYYSTDIFRGKADIYILYEIKNTFWYAFVQKKIDKKLSSGKMKV
jgi:hypothetical protein